MPETRKLTGPKWESSPEEEESLLRAFENAGEVLPSEESELGYDPLTGNVFCATGPGGGVDPTCKEGEGGGGEHSPDTAFGKPKPPPNVEVRYREGAEDAVKAMFGDIDVKRLAAASNAKEGAIVKIEKIPNSTGVEVTVNNPDGGVAKRAFYKTPDGEKFVNNKVFINPPGKEKGADILAEQVKSLRELGVNHMKTDATRQDNSDPPLVGHIVWPKLGYEGKLTDEQFNRLPDNIKEAMGQKKGKFGVFGKVPGSRSVQQLYATPGGAEAWAKHGDTIYNMTFDLSEGSASMKKLDSYLKSRKAKG